MADPHAHDDYVRGSQEISEQVSTFHLFMGLAKWGSLAIVVALAFLTICFMPNGNFFGAAFTAIVLTVVGWWFLREKPQAH